MSYKKLSLALLICPVLACDTASGPDDATFEGVDPSGLGAPTGKADGNEVSVGSAGAYDVLQFRGDAAFELYDVMDRAGGLFTASQGGLDYVYGVYTICVTNGEAAACNIYSDEASAETGDFVALVHGVRFDSGASELFGALARSKDLAPASIFEVESGRFLCGKTSVDVWCGLRAPTGGGEDMSTLSLSFAGLPVLGEDFVYEGWLITADGPVTSGRFVVEEGVDDYDMEVDRELAEASTLFVLTIEPAVGDDPAPSMTHIVAGPIEDGVAVLDTTHPAALGSDFTESDGGFILETPSSADVADDYAQGVWFLDPAAGPGPSLDLPVLPDGWVYEGWVVGEDGPISTGRFTDVAAADSDAGGPAAGPDGTPPFPGQDFIDPPMDLVGGAVVISVEPEPDDGPAPFALKPLMGEVEDEGPGGFQGLGNIAQSNAITGLAVLEWVSTQEGQGAPRARAAVVGSPDPGRLLRAPTRRRSHPAPDPHDRPSAREARGRPTGP